MWGRARRRAPPRCGIQGWGERRGPRGPEPANNGGAGGGGEGAPPQRPAVPASWPLHARARPARLALPFLFATVPAALQSRRLPPHAPPRPDEGSRCLSASTRDIRLPILRRLLSHFLLPPTTPQSYPSLPPGVGCAPGTIYLLTDPSVSFLAPTLDICVPLPYLFSISITFGVRSPSSFFGLSAVIILHLEPLASPGAVPLGPVVPAPWRSILDLCWWRHCCPLVFSLDIIPPLTWAQVLHISALVVTRNLLCCASLGCP